MSCPPRPGFAAPHLSEGQQGAAAWLRSCLPNRLKGSGHVDPWSGMPGPAQGAAGGNAGDPEKAQAWPGWQGRLQQGRPSSGLHLRE